MTLGSGSDDLLRRRAISPDVTIVPDRETLKAVISERPDIKASSGRREVEPGSELSEEASPQSQPRRFYNRTSYEMGRYSFHLHTSFRHKAGGEEEAQVRLEQAKIKRPG
jgi:hypothetical protein